MGSYQLRCRHWPRTFAAEDALPRSPSCSALAGCHGRAAPDRSAV